MATISGIGRLIESSPEIRGGRPCIAGTGISVHRIAVWSSLDYSAEEIADRIGPIDLAQVYAALAYYHANRAQIDAESRKMTEPRTQLTRSAAAIDHGPNDSSLLLR